MGGRPRGFWTPLPSGHTVEHGEIWGGEEVSMQTSEISSRTRGSLTELRLNYLSEELRQEPLK